MRLQPSPRLKTLARHAAWRRLDRALRIANEDTGKLSIPTGLRVLKKFFFAEKKTTDCEDNGKKRTFHSPVIFKE